MRVLLDECVDQKLRNHFPDRGMEFQQDLTQRKIAVIILKAKSNRLKDLLPLVPVCLAHLDSIQPGQVLTITD